MKFSLMINADTGERVAVKPTAVAILFAQRLMRWFCLIDAVTRVVGARHRLRCPRCRAVGTWKPHGGWFERSHAYHVPRWLCKWCGLYFRADLPNCIGEAHLGATVWEEGEGATPMSHCRRAEGDGYYDPWAG